MSINHDIAQQWLLAAQDGALAAEHEPLLAAHLATCEQCRAFGAQLDGVEARMRFSLKMRYPLENSAETANARAKLRQAIPTRRPFIWQAAPLVAGLAALVIMALLIFDSISTPLEVAPATMQTAVPILQPITPTATPAPLESVVTFGDQLALIDFEIKPIDSDTDRLLSLDLAWQLQQPTTDALNVFIHIVDQDDQIIGQADQPLQDTSQRAPITVESPQTVSYELALPTELPDGNYIIQIGVYAQENGERLAVESNVYDAYELARFDIATTPQTVAESELPPAQPTEIPPFVPPTATPTHIPTQPPTPSAAPTDVPATLVPTPTSTQPVGQQFFDEFEAALERGQPLDAYFAESVYYGTNNNTGTQSRASVLNEFAQLAAINTQTTLDACTYGINSPNGVRTMSCHMTMNNEWRNALGMSAYQSRLAVHERDGVIESYLDYQLQSSFQADVNIIRTFFKWLEQLHPEADPRTDMNVIPYIRYVNSAELIPLAREWTALGQP